MITLSFEFEGIKGTVRRSIIKDAVTITALAEKLNDHKDLYGLGWFTEQIMRTLHVEVDGAPLALPSPDASKEAIVTAYEQWLLIDRLWLDKWLAALTEVDKPLADQKKAETKTDQ